MADINGKKHSETIRTEVKAAGKNCKLAVVLVGDDPASIVYINMKKRACQEVGFDFELLHLPENSTQGEVLALIDKINNDHIVFLPITVAASYALLNTLRVPRQVVVDNDIAKLQVDTFGGGFCSD